IVELETDKVTIEVPAPVSGVLEVISVNEGDTVEVGALIAAIAEGAAASASAPKQEAKSEAKEAAPAAAPAKAESKGETKAGDMPPAPSAAKLMAEKGVSASDVDGSGKRGQVL